MNVSNFKETTLYSILWETNDPVIAPIREKVYETFIESYEHLLPNDIQNKQIINPALLLAFKIEFTSLFKEDLETGEVVLNTNIDTVLANIKNNASIKVNNLITLNTSTVSSLMYWFIFGSNDVLNNVRFQSKYYINSDAAINKKLDWWLQNITLVDTKKLVFYAGKYNTTRTKLNEWAINWSNLRKLFQFNYKQELADLLWKTGSSDFEVRLKIMQNYGIDSWERISFSDKLKQTVFKELDDKRYDFLIEMFSYKLRGIVSFNPYDFLDDNAATLLDLNTISFAHKRGWINLGDLTLKTHTIIKDSEIIIPVTIRKSMVDIQPNGDKYLIITSSIMSNNKDTFNVEYRQKFLDIEYALTNALLKDNDIKGVTFINRSSNTNFMVQKYKKNELHSLMLHGLDEKGELINAISKYRSVKTDFDYVWPMLSTDFAKDIEKIMLSLGKKLNTLGVLSKNVPFTERSSIHKYISTKDIVPTLYEPTTFIKNKVEYVKDVPLNDDERDYKFYAFDTLSASQLNAIAFEMGGVSQNSNIEWFNDENKDKLIKSIDTAIINKYGFDVKYSRKKGVLPQLIKKSFTSEEVDRMDFGNEVEQSILHRINTRLNNDELPIKSVKETLYFDDLNIFVDIDGFRGEDLDNLESVVEVKTTTARGGYEEEIEHGNVVISDFQNAIYLPKILTKYYFQLLTYFKVFKPKYLEIVGIVSSAFNGKNSIIFKHKFIPNKVDLDFYDQILKLVKERFEIILNSSDKYLYNEEQKTIAEIVKIERDKRYQKVKDNLWVQKYSQIKHH